jgi:PAS domain S-box-containing protein
MLSVTKSLYGLPKKMPMRKKRKVFLNHPLLSWDISNPRLGLTAVNPDVLELLRLCSRDDLVFNPRSVLSEHYDALVLTGSDRRIVWASKGFETMTGFTRDFARGKKPVFLQGRNTSELTLAEMRVNLTKGVRFSVTIANYRKSGEEYQCHISVIPIFDSHQKLTHFLALEKEVL